MQPLQGGGFRTEREGCNHCRGGGFRTGREGCNHRLPNKKLVQNTHREGVRVPVIRVIHRSGNQQALPQ